MLTLYHNLYAMGKKNTNELDEKIKSYIQQINDALTEEALDYLYDNGDDDILSDEELCKLFSKKFMHESTISTCPYGGSLALVYDDSTAEMTLFSIYVRMTAYRVKCDIQNVQSIIDSAIECLNNCMKEGNLDPYTNN